MPDLYRLGLVPWCWEYKAWSAVLVNPQRSGRFSTADGWFVAFGGTEEKARFDTLGVGERAGDRAFDRLTGVGRVEPADGDYSDALSKGYGVTLCHAETNGAVAPAFDALLRRLARLAREPGVQDCTSYGESASSPRDFYRHHLAAHSAAVSSADATVVLEHVRHLNFLLTHGLH